MVDLVIRIQCLNHLFKAAPVDGATLYHWNLANLIHLQILHYCEMSRKITYDPDENCSETLGKISLQSILERL